MRQSGGRRGDLRGGAAPDHALRAHLAEFGVIAPQGVAHVGRLSSALEYPGSGLPPPVRELGTLLLELIGDLSAKIDGLEREVRARARQAMISSPSVLLLDEPMIALDIKLKKTLQTELKRLHRQLGVTFVHVTHDLEEAMMLAARICVMHAGRILQIGVPDDIYYRPQGKFVAEFIGETNLIDITISEVGDHAISYSCPVIVDADGRISRRLVEPGLKSGPAVMMVRPELIRLLSESNEVDCRTNVQIEEVFVRGATIQYRGIDAVGRAPLILEVPGTSELRLKIGESVSVGWDKKDIFVFQRQHDTDD